MKQRMSGKRSPLLSGGGFYRDRSRAAIVAAMLAFLPWQTAKASDPGSVGSADATGSEDREQSAGGALLFHSAPSRFEPGETNYELLVRVEGEFAGRAISLQGRRAGSTEYQKFPFLRSEKGDYVAAVSGEWVQAPGFEYYIETEEAHGEVRSRFADARDPHLVIVEPSQAEQNLEVRLKRYEQRRSVIEASFRHISFGQDIRYYDTGEPLPVHRVYADYVNTMEIAYTYRFLQDSIYQITFGYGMIGGALGTDSPDRLEYWDNTLPQSFKQDSIAPLPGLYYGFGKAYWELFDFMGVEPMLLMGGSYDGFELGGGLTLRFGPMPGSHFDLGIEGITHVGIKFITEFELAAEPWLRVSLRNELTDYPMGEGLATLPSVNVTFLLGSLELTGCVGYGRRKEYDEGGLTLGAGASLQF